MGASFRRSSSPQAPSVSLFSLSDEDLDNESNLGLVVVLVLFSVVVLVTIFSLVFVVWYAAAALPSPVRLRGSPTDDIPACFSRFRQRRRDHVTMQEVASVVKMKSMPI